VVWNAGSQPIGTKAESTPLKSMTGWSIQCPEVNPGVLVPAGEYFPGWVLIFLTGCPGLWYGSDSGREMFPR
jgi:hypothetical protein